MQILSIFEHAEFQADRPINLMF